ncbi:glycosyltransferase [Pararhodonellum marinum]|uniref:glycosyltransferase n=1 Tax=Pararhodonellum marinum TaxID=2755358 RepID=UPI00188E2CB2|nr:glycosyltransferase [Pararhodonellum marinum]
MKNPLVSIICICFNQEKFVYDALSSLINLDFYPLEIFLVDNGSKDKSREVINTWYWLHKEHFKITKMFYDQSQSYCEVFNKALALSKGKYIIDFSCDDILLKGHLHHALASFSENPKAKAYSSQAMLINETGEALGLFSERKKNNIVPKGFIYRELVGFNCICTSTLVFDSTTLKLEGGYDETLVYEDFDILVRLARSHPFAYSEFVGVKKRLHQNAFSKQQYQVKTSRMLPSTFKVCMKIKLMNETEEENEALQFRVMHELKHALASANFAVALKFIALANAIEVSDPKLVLYTLWAKSRIDLSFFYAWMKKDPSPQPLQ